MIHRVKQIIESGEIGALKSVEEIFAIPRGVYLKPDDIRYDFALGGGSLTSRRLNAGSAVDSYDRMPGA